jgi:D-hydroxyproline dehydrogenase subunit gamma
MIQIFINGQSILVLEGISVAAALAQAKSYSRLSVSGEQRTPFCGMGVCQECRVNIDGIRVLACQTLCQQGMKVEIR